MKTGKFLKGLGTLVLVIGVLLPSIFSMVHAAPLPNVSDTGVDYTNERTLSIRPKAHTKVGVTDSDPQSYFAADPSIDGQSDFPNPEEATAFTVTRLAAKNVGEAIVPSNSSTYVADPASSPVTIKVNDGTGGQLDLTLPSPQSLQTMLDLGDVSQLPQIANNVIVIDGDGTEITDPAAVQTLLQKCFYGTAQDSLADGYYKIEEYHSSNPQAWSTVVGIPTFKDSKIGALEAEDINYDIVVYPKILPMLEPQFDSYVDLVSYTTTTASTTRNARLTDADADWETTSIDKGSIHTFSAAFQLNGFSPDMWQTQTEKDIALLYSMTELTSIDDIHWGTAAVLPGAATLPTLTGTKTVGKDFAFSGALQLGAIVEDIGHPENTQYVPIDTDTNTEDVVVAYSRTTTTRGYLDITARALRLSAGNANDFAPIKGVDSRGYIIKAADLYNTMMQKLGTDIIAGLNTGLQGADFSVFAGRYTNWQDVFGSTSSIRVHLTASYPIKVSGSAFTAGESVNAKPFMYGATTVQANNGGGNARPTKLTVTADDFFSFDSSDHTGEYEGTVFTKKRPTEANVHTGAINAIKVTDEGSALTGAKFAVIRSDGKYATNASSETTGYVWAEGTPTTSNALVKTSSATGEVRFDGLAIDGETTYQLTELEAPTGFKKMKNTTSDAIDPVRLTWAEHKAQTGDGAMTKVINVPILALPNTGGRGLWVLLALSAAVLAGGYFIRRNGQKQKV